MRRPRWWELAPEALLAAGLGWFAITEPSAALSAFASSKALVLMGATTIGWVVARVGAARLVPWVAARIAAFAAGALGVLAIVVLPAYQSTTVVETFPRSPVEAVSSAPVPAPAPGPPDAEVPAAPPAPTPAPVPVVLASATLHGIHHRASGTVRLYRSPDGSQVVGLEDIDIQPGPHYDVYVVPGAGAEAPDGGARLDDLRGNRGTQYYDVPAGLDITSGTWTVLVWCRVFAVPVAAATPA